MARGATVATVADKAYYAAWAIRAGHKNGQTRKQTELRIKHMEYISQSTALSPTAPVLHHFRGVAGSST